MDRKFHVSLFQQVKPMFIFRLERRDARVEVVAQDELRSSKFDREAIIHKRLELDIILLSILLVPLGINLLNFLLWDQITSDCKMPSIDNKVDAGFCRYTGMIVNTC